MAEEPVVEPVVEEVVVEPVVEPEPHPLEEGGVRFNEVYSRMKAAEDRERAANERISRLEGAAATLQRPQPTGPVIYTPQQLQTAVDQGLITPMFAADLLSKQNADAAATRTSMQVEQIRTHGAKLQAAGVEVNQYIDRVPALKDTNSADFSKVRDAAYSASDDMNLPVTDLRVQRRALREVYGSLDKIAKGSEERESSRRASLPHVETSAGGTRQPVASKDSAWKKDVPAAYLSYWEKRGYTEEQMKAEAKYVTKTPRKVTGK